MRKAIRDVGARLVFLPKYSPEGRGTRPSKPFDLRAGRVATEPRLTVA